jgi:3-oxoacyl-[acyl-carrier protein] reductase
MGKLEKKVALITGAGSGIGKATAKKFADEGALVIVQDFDKTSAEEVSANLTGVGHFAISGDVSSEQDMKNVFSEVEKRCERLDVLVNNAGISGNPEGLSSITYESFMRMLEVHMGGTFICTQAALPLMAAGSSIVNLSSIAGLAGWGPVHYASAKGAILGFTRASARELGGLGIRVNAVAPGVVETPMTEDLDEALLAPLIMMSPLGRIGQADEIASTILYLACGDSSFVTGQWISPNGGLITI